MRFALSLIGRLWRHVTHKRVVYASRDGQIRIVGYHHRWLGRK